MGVFTFPIAIILKYEMGGYQRLKFHVRVVVDYVTHDGGRMHA